MGGTAVSPTEWSFETWLTLGMVLLGAWVIAYGLLRGQVELSWVGLAFVVLSLFLWAGRPSAYE
jgi:hypothetical protein